MLILKGNLYFARSWAALAWALLLCALQGAVAGPVLAPARAPEAVVAEFYGWYLDVLAADQDPLSDRHARFTGYVARDLVRRLVDRLRHPPPPAGDYFLQAATAPPGHAGVRTALLRRDAVHADVLVTLGAAEDARMLVVALVAEGGAWKIAAVRPALEAESSPQRPAI